MRTRAAVRMLRTQPVVLVPADVTDLQVEEHVRRWSPEVTRVADTVVALGDVFELHGPVGYAEGLWHRAMLPPRYPRAYAVALGRAVTVR